MSVFNVELRKDVLEKVLIELKNSNTMNKLCSEYRQEINYLDLIPMCFADLDVSARCEHGIVYINKKLLKTPDKIPQYCSHEITHHFQQCFGDGPTKGSTDDDYLSNVSEVDGFQTQTEFISEKDGKQEAEKYIDQVLDHHDMNGKERKDKKKELLKDASKQLKFQFPKPKKESIKDFDKSEIFKAIDENSGTKHDFSKFVPRPSKKLDDINLYRKQQLSKLWNEIKNSINIDSNDARERIYNKENENDQKPAKEDYLRQNKDQLRFKYYQQKDFNFIDKNIKSLSDDEIESLKYLTLQSKNSGMSDFLKAVPKFRKRKKLIPFVILCIDKKINEIIGWLSAELREDKSIDVNTFVDRNYRDHGLGSLLLDKFKSIRSKFWPSFEPLVTPWNDTAFNFYNKNKLDIGNDSPISSVFDKKENKDYEYFEDDNQMHLFSNQNNIFSKFANKIKNINKCYSCNHPHTTHKEHSNGNEYCVVIQKKII